MHIGLLNQLASGQEKIKQSWKIEVKSENFCYWHVGVWNEFKEPEKNRKKNILKDGYQDQVFLGGEPATYVFAFSAEFPGLGKQFS